MGQPFPLEFASGIVKVDAPYALRGRYIDADKVRFVKGKPEKWKGWEAFTTSATLGIPRALKVWDDFAASRWLAIGTHRRLYLSTTDAVLSNITPYRETGTLAANPFAMTNTSPLVTVTDLTHGLMVGSYVNFSGATAAGGITINGEYTVTTVTDVDHYVITHSANATSTTTGGGAAVLYSYELDAGEANVIFGAGYGTGTYGTGTWGTPRTSSNFTIYSRTWSLENYGENLLALPSGSYIYQWDPDTPTVRAAKVTNSPTGNAMFMTNERYPVVLGSNGDNMALAWPDQNDITNWTPSSTSTANERRLQVGSRLVAGSNLIGTANIVWSDSAVYSMNYTGARNFVYNTLIVADKCGLIGPMAFAVAGGRAYWMSSFDFFMYGGSVQAIPNSVDIRDWLFDQLDGQQNWKVTCRFSSQHNEILWNFIVDGDFEPSLYVAVSLDDFSWTHGTLNRTAWVEKSGVSPVVYGADENGYVFEHEVGLDADGVALAWFIESAPLDLDSGSHFMDIWGYIPNFQRQVGDIQVTLQTWDLPQDTATQETQALTIIEGGGVVDAHLSGRQASVRLDGFALGGDFRLGLPRVEISQSGSRRGGP